MLGTAHAVPTISQISLRGLQLGATTTLVIEGADLAGESRVMEFGESLAAQLNAFYEDLAQAINGHGAVACSGEDGRNAVELANAMILSSELERPVTLPLDREEYTQLIARKSESQTVASTQLSRT